MAGKGRAIFDSLAWLITLHARQMQQHREARRPLNQRANRRAIQAKDEVTFPVAWEQTFADLNWSLIDAGGTRNEATTVAARAAPTAGFVASR